MAIKLHVPANSVKVGGRTSSIYLAQQAIKGDDGGYYIPSIDSEGYLTWTRSEEDMPEVAGANIKGKDGKDGENGLDGKNTVWCGDDTPDESYDIWIAPGGASSTFMTAEQVQAYIDAALGGVENGSY